MVLVRFPLGKTFPKAILFFDYHSFGKLRRSSNSDKTHYRFLSQDGIGVVGLGLRGQFSLLDNKNVARTIT